MTPSDVFGIGIVLTLGILLAVIGFAGMLKWVAQNKPYTKDSVGAFSLGVAITSAAFLTAVALLAKAPIPYSLEIPLICGIAIGFATFKILIFYRNH